MRNGNSEGSQAANELQLNPVLEPGVPGRDVLTQLRFLRYCDAPDADQYGSDGMSEQCFDPNALNVQTRSRCIALRRCI